MCLLKQNAELGISYFISNNIMKIQLSFICLVFYCVTNAQTIQCKVLDADDNKPLYFSTITYGKDAKVTFSDSLGNFYLHKEILITADSVTIDFVGYASSKIASKHIIPNQPYFLIGNKQTLEEVVVKDCKDYEEVNTKKKSSSNFYYSMGA
jgi:hypothetical protein